MQLLAALFKMTIFFSKALLSCHIIDFILMIDSEGVEKLSCNTLRPTCVITVVTVDNETVPDCYLCSGLTK